MTYSDIIAYFIFIVKLLLPLFFLRILLLRIIDLISIWIFILFRSSLLTTDKLIKLMSRTNENLKVLNLIGISNLMDFNILNWIGRLCPNIEELQLDNGHMNRRSVKEFARKVKGNKTCLGRFQDCGSGNSNYNVLHLVRVIL